MEIIPKSTIREFCRFSIQKLYKKAFKTNFWSLLKTSTWRFLRRETYQARSLKSDLVHQGLPVCKPVLLLIRDPDQQHQKRSEAKFHSGYSWSKMSHFSIATVRFTSRNAKYSKDRSNLIFDGTTFLKDRPMFLLTPCKQKLVHFVNHNQRFNFLKEILL